MARIMIIEDDPEINSLLQLHLEREGHEVLARHHGMHLEDEGLETIDLFLVDIMLPMIDGFELIGVIRSKTWAPVIMLTAKSSESDRIRGLDLGADDYVCKPFSVSELMSRVHAQLRRMEKITGQTGRLKELKCGALKLDVERHCCFREQQGGLQEINLNPIEFKMLNYFMSHQERVLSKTQIYEAIWGDTYYGDDNTVMVHIRRLREKIEIEPNKPMCLLTVRGVGYKLVCYETEGR